jgi:hypothetical protein
MVKVERQLVRLPWAADGCPWAGKLRTVLPLKNRDVIRDSAVQLGLTHQRGGASQVRSFAESTWVQFDTLSPATVDAYIATGEPFGKAGAYGIQVRV